MSALRPRVAISRCLLGDEVRYDGGHKLDRPLVALLGALVDLVAVCPEVEIGMGVPREPIHLVAAADGVSSGRSRVRLLGVTSGTDWTDAMVRFGETRLAELRLQRVAGYVLKSGSPSCGPRGIPVADDPANDGRGLFAEALATAWPELPVDDEERLSDARAREDFIARVFAYHARLPPA